MPAKPQTTDPRPPVRFPLVGTMYKRDSSSSVISDQYFQNCAFTKRTNPETNQDTVVTSKRLGFTASTSVTGVTSALDAVYTSAFYYDAPIIMWTDGTDAIVKKANTTIATFDNYGTGETSRLTPCYSTSLSTPALLVWNIDVSSNRTASFYPSGGAVTAISDVDFPDDISGNFAFLDGYAFIMTDDGYIHNSSLNDLTTWDATNFLSAGFEADGGATVARYKHLLVGFGRERTEFFEDVGNATGSPLQRLVDKGFNIGIYKDDSASTTSAAVSPCRRYIEAFDTIFWISGNMGDQSTRAIYYLENYTPKRLTTPDIESIFAYDGVDKIIGTFNYGTEPCLMVKTEDGNYYVCFINHKLWSKWVFGTGTPTAIVSGAEQIIYTDLGTKQVKMTFSNQTSPSYQDDSNSFTFIVQTSKVDAGTERKKRLHKLALIGNDSAATSTTAISWSDDDYVTFSTARNLDMNSLRPYLMNCGAFRRRAFKITNSSNAPLELEAIELELSTLSK